MTFLYSTKEGSARDIPCREYQDTEGNILSIDRETDFYPDSPEVISFLNEWGYNGSGDWDLA